MIGGYIARKGEKEYLRPYWESGSFDFWEVCRLHGRNDAVWLHCYCNHIRGIPIPTEKQLKRLVTRANRATGGVNHLGERERYMLKEAIATAEQVSSYGPALGVIPLVEKRLHWATSSKSRYATPPARRLLKTICELASACGRGHEIRASHRQLASRAGLHKDEVAPLLHSLHAAKQVFPLGFTPCHNGQPRGTTRLSLRPPPPTPMVDEVEKSYWDAAAAEWKWRRKDLRGSTTPWAWNRNFARGLALQRQIKLRETSLENREISASEGASLARGQRPGLVPYVYDSPPLPGNAFYVAPSKPSKTPIDTLSSRGSP